MINSSKLKEPVSSFKKKKEIRFGYAARQYL